MVQIALRIQPVGLGRLQQGKNRSAGVGAGLGVAEKPVFPADDNRSNRILHLVVADFNFAVVEERAKVLPLVQGVSENQYIDIPTKDGQRSGDRGRRYSLYLYDSP